MKKVEIRRLLAAELVNISKPRTIWVIGKEVNEMFYLKKQHYGLGAYPLKGRTLTKLTRIKNIINKYAPRVTVLISNEVSEKQQ